MAKVVVGVALQLGEPNHFLRVDAFPVNDSGDLAVRAAGIKADAAAVHVAAHGLGGFVGCGAGVQRQVQNFQLPLVELVEERVVKVTRAIAPVSLLQLLGQLAAAADGNPEAAGGPEQELDIALHIAVVGLRHFGCAVDAGVVNGDAALVTLQSDSDGLFSPFQVSGAPDAEGDKCGVQPGSVLHGIFDA